MKRARYLEIDIEKICFAAKKMAFVSGPRQCGKTTMAKRLLQQRSIGHYYNWDETTFRKLWIKNPSQIIPQGNGKSIPLIVLDEIHKAKLWKRNLKGVYDSLEEPCDILVTGSARLNTYRKGSDSLLGRYYHFRLHPFSLAELLQTTHLSPDDLIDFIFNSGYKSNKAAQECLLQLEKFGPFPEPFLAASMQTLNLWQRGRTEKIIREDLRDLSRLPELSQIEMLTSLLPERAANLLSLRSLSEDLEVAYTTVKRWLNYLNELYYLFTIKPYSRSLQRSLKKANKLYLWDWSEIESEGARFENLVASHLLKYCHYLTDTGVGVFELYYLRNKEQQEIDFLITRDRKPWLPIEVKLNYSQVSDNWKAFMPLLSCKKGVQIVKKPNIYQKNKLDCGEVLIISADMFLSLLV